MMHSVVVVIVEWLLILLGMKKESMPSASQMDLLENKKTLPFSFGQVLTCDPNLTRELAAALQEHFPTLNSEFEKGVFAAHFLHFRSFKYLSIWLFIIIKYFKILKAEDLSKS